MRDEKWDNRFLDLAEMIASWSKDPSTKIGAVVVGPYKEIRATGYNGPVRGIDDSKLERYERPQKYDFFEHAERNAIYNAVRSGICLKDCTIYVTQPSCVDCARAIIQSGIRTVIVRELITQGAPDGTWRTKLETSRQMFQEAGLEYMEYKK